jgi:DNA processing protein
MTLAPHAAAGLIRLAGLLGRDLQRASRAVGGPAALWRADGATLARLLRLEGTAAAEAAGLRAGLDGRACLRELGESGLTVLPLGGPGYPRRLADVYDPPFGLVAEGWDAGVAAALTEAPAVAVVGARRATVAGAAFARALAEDLARRGAVVVSGLARGIDAAAHEGALAAGGRTVAVLGCGTACGYPRANRDLRRRLLGSGAVLSEYWPDTPPAPWRFPARNRIVAGLAHAVVVVEAAGRSGALITADFALEGGRPVLAVPNAPWVEASAGCNELLRAGAAVCTCAEDVVAECPDLPWLDGPAGPRGPDLPPGGLPARVLAALREAPRRADELVAELGAGAGPVAAALGLLEMEGAVARGDGGRWVAPARGG